MEVCVHHWYLEPFTSKDGTTHAVCLKCGTEKKLPPPKYHKGFNILYWGKERLRDESDWVLQQIA